MPKDELPNGYNPFDKLSEDFIKQYKYELLASFALLSLLGGIVLAVKVVDGRKAKVEVKPAESQVEAVQDKKLVVEISGEVGKPGVYELDSGSRVNDLLRTAGDLTDKADSGWIEKNLNRAQVLTDGQKIYIPAKGEANSKVGETNGSSASATQIGDKVSLNTASKSELESLPYIGEKRAEYIIQARPFKSVEELLNIPGINAARLQDLKDMVVVY